MRRAAAVAVAVLLAAAWAGCGAAAGPADDAAGLVPEEALLFLHVSTDPDRRADRDALQALGRLRAFRRLGPRIEESLRRLGSLGEGTGVSLARDVRPWLGDEAAVALVPGADGRAGALFVLDVRSRAKAREFLQRLGAPSGREERHGRRITVYGPQATAFASGHLLAGPLPAVRSALDAAEDEDESLAGRRAFQDAAEEAPSSTWASAYAPAAGVRRLLAPRGGAAALLARALSPPGLRGTFVSLRGKDRKLRVRTRSVLRGKARGHLPRSFRPRAGRVLPEDVAAAAEFRGGDRVLETLARGVLAAPLGALQSRGLDLPATLGPLLRGRTALALLPRPDVPAALLVARTKRPDFARERLALLQERLRRVYFPASGEAGAAPVINEREVGGATAFQLRLGPSIELDTLVADGRVMLATDLAALAAARRRGGRLEELAAFRAVTRGRPEKVTSLIFLAPGRLLPLVEGTGLARSQQYLAVREDLRRLRAIGLHGTSGEGETTSEITLSLP